MKLERVGTIAVGGVLLQVAGEVDDTDGFKRTFLKELIQCLLCKFEVGQTLVQMPQPMQSVSDIVASLSVGVTSMHSLPITQLHY